MLVDTGPDLRQQALKHSIDRVDAILFTHAHADHVMGLDEVRRFNMLSRSQIPAFADARTATQLKRTFAYVFDPATEPGGGIPQIDLQVITGAFDIGPIRVVPIPLLHGSQPILGFRFGDFAYLTDCSAIPETSWPLLEGVRTLVVDALRHRPHPTHFSVAEAVAVASVLQPQDTWLIHICHDLPHAETNRLLPRTVALAYDGLELDLEVGTARDVHASSSR